eukprot:CAMPEP_0198499240 /NCGR_PEP_ID=MMETSP1462-20131121/7495_1 /TAXON_ID=1333877 /ORGANISM="Brandtodinium nutriculum, Strain RCC3387" /LENGTH=147 /DNA_ID=CAMNT_0044228203 /DNA_START=20 /DNA_END=460 /DNA_ORIENTATION=+
MGNICAVRAVPQLSAAACGRSWRSAAWRDGAAVQATGQKTINRRACSPMTWALWEKAGRVLWLPSNGGATRDASNERLRQARRRLSREDAAHASPNKGVRALAPGRGISSARKSKRVGKHKTRGGPPQKQKLHREQLPRRWYAAKAA